MSATLTRNGKTKTVKNLGWLLRNWQEVAHLSFDIKAVPGQIVYDGVFTATLKDGGTYVTDYASLSVWLEFISRPVFFTLPADVRQDGKVNAFTVGEMKHQVMRSNPWPYLVMSI